VILREQLPEPSAYGIDPEKAKLEVWTEFFDPPVPLIEPTLLQRADGTQEDDSTLIFGAMRIGPGRAFALPEQAEASDPEHTRNSLSVSKEWAAIDGTFLIESLPYLEVKPHLNTLPEPQGALKLKRDQPQRFIAQSKPFTYLNGRVRFYTAARGLTRTFTGDALQRLLRVDFPDASYIEHRYTVDGVIGGAKRLDRTWTRDRLGKITISRYNGLRQLIEQIDPLNRSTTYSYCDCGALEAITEASGISGVQRTTSFTYTAVATGGWAERYASDYGQHSGIDQPELRRQRQPVGRRPPYLRVRC
jgi:YD repeat-containing protein